MELVMVVVEVERESFLSKGSVMRFCQDLTSVRIFVQEDAVEHLEKTESCFVCTV